jgi:undecaprenyl diphosphate synthase
MSESKKSINHIGVIMDGNRRWAKAQNQSKFYGYEQGFNKFVEMLDWCLDEGVGYLTVYTFSTENFKRDREDFKYIYDLILHFFEKSFDYCTKNSIVFRFIGRSDLIQDDLKLSMERINNISESPNLTVQIAFGYGGRDEMVRAMKKVAGDCISGELSLSEIDEGLVNRYLDTQGVPDADMIIRTGNANRLSNFLLWQSNYSEICFSKTMWPAFTREEFNGFINNCIRNRKTEYGS